MPKLYSDLEVRTGRYWATTRKRLTVALPDCILLWAQWKMQLFLCEKHRELSFPVVSTTYEDRPPTAICQNEATKWEKRVECSLVCVRVFRWMANRDFSDQFTQNLQNMGLEASSLILVWARY